MPKRKIDLGLGRVPLVQEEGDGLLIMIWRAKEDAPEFHVIDRGLMTEGRIERQMNGLFAAVMQSRTRGPDVEGRAEEMKRVSDIEQARCAKEKLAAQVYIERNRKR